MPESRPRADALRRASAARRLKIDYLRTTDPPEYREYQSKDSIGAEIGASDAEHSKPGMRLSAVQDESRLARRLVFLSNDNPFSSVYVMHLSGI